MLLNNVKNEGSNLSALQKAYLSRRTNTYRGMLHIILLSSFCSPKIDVALKITIEFLIYHY